MLDAKTLQNYTNCATELQKLLDFSSKNNYLLTNGFTNDKSAMVYIFTEQLPFGQFQTAIKVDKKLFYQLLTEGKLADYVIKEFVGGDKE